MAAETATPVKWWRLTKTVAFPCRTSAAADIGRGLRQITAGQAPQAARIARLAQDAAQLVVGQRGPVGLGQLTAQAVDGVRAGLAIAHRFPGSRRSHRASPPTVRVTAAATVKDRIDADIQLAGVKPMSRPNEVHPAAHQDTYPGLMSW